MKEADYKQLEKRPYKRARSDIKTGDILLCSGNHPISHLIRKFSNSMFSHVAFVFSWNRRVLVLESVEDDGVRAVPLSQYVYDYENSGAPYSGGLFIARHRSALSRPKVNHMLGCAADLLNKRYDKDEIAAITWRIITGRGRHEEDDEYICSEFVEKCFAQIDVPFKKDPGGFIYPGHIATDPQVDGQFQVTPM